MIERKTSLVPLTKWPEKHSYPTIRQLRWLVFNEGTNGFSACVVRIGRRVFIEENRFFEWIRMNNPNISEK